MRCKPRPLGRDAHPSVRIPSCSMSDPEFRRHDPLSDFASEQRTFLGETKRVFVAGQGPAVIVMTEVPGITPQVARFARWVRDAGFTVYLPDLFGDAGRPLSLGYALRTIGRNCVSREFAAFAANRSSPVTAWLRALAADVHPRCGGRGVGAIGMCFTGNFALSMMLEPAVVAPVLSQPSLPLQDPGGLHIAPDELAQVRERMQREDLVCLAYRFEGDPACQEARFDAYRAALGDRFVGTTLPASCAKRGVTPGPAHSVVTNHLVDRDGEPTRAAVDEILVFFRERLVGGTKGTPSTD